MIFMQLFTDFKLDFHYTAKELCFEVKVNKIFK